MSAFGKTRFYNSSVFTCLRLISRASGRSHRRCSVKKVFLKILQHSQHLCQSLFFNKVAGLSLASLLKKRLWHRCFPVNFVKFLRTPFFNRTPPVAPSDCIPSNIFFIQLQIYISRGVNQIFAVTLWVMT